MLRKRPRQAQEGSNQILGVRFGGSEKKFAALRMVGLWARSEEQQENILNDEIKLHSALRIIALAHHAFTVSNYATMLQALNSLPIPFKQNTNIQFLTAIALFGAGSSAQAIELLNSKKWYSRNSDPLSQLLVQLAQQMNALVQEAAKATPNATHTVQPIDKDPSSLAAQERLIHCQLQLHRTQLMLKIRQLLNTSTVQLVVKTLIHRAGNGIEKIAIQEKKNSDELVQALLLRK